MSGLSHTISQITEELSTDECKRISYLCGDLDPDRFSADPRGTLHALLGQTRVDCVFLMELVLKIKRYDLLREVLSTSKSSVESMLRNRQAVPEYRSLMADVSEDMDTEDLKSLAFLLRGTLPKQKLENVQSFLDIVVELEKLDQLSSEKTDFIESCLRSIHRTDLAKKISRFQQTALMTNPEACPPPERPQHFRPPSPHTSFGFSSVSCQVRQTRKFCDKQTTVMKELPSSSSCCKEEVYSMTDPRGVCLIIDCVGTEGDELEQTFLALRFSVTVHRLLSVQELVSTLRDVSRQQELHRACVFICCIISRSRSSLLLATDPLAPGLSLDALRTLFSSHSCPGLAGKPKLFFIQSYEVCEECEVCVGQGDGELETDGPGSLCRSRTLPVDADVFWSHCWTDGHQLETPSHRSVYLQALRASLTQAHSRRTHVVDMHMAVNRAVYEHNRRSAASYVINLRHTLRKNLYLS
ncbi:CASP8 and FADD-like apoptosis regulator isoform X2 [Siphateles boraxobius]